MSCPSLLRRQAAAAESLGEPSRGPVYWTRALAGRFCARVRRDDTLGQFARFVFVGGASTAAYAVLFIALGGFGYLAANVVSTLVSSVVANELHRRLTFHADERVGFWASQAEAGGVSLFGLVVTTVALAWLDSAVGSAHAFLQITLVATVTGLIGLMRFAALRWIFRPAPEADAEPDAESTVGPAVGPTVEPAAR